MNSLQAHTSAALVLGFFFATAFSLPAHADPDAVAVLPFDEGVGILAGDVSGSGNDGTLTGGAAFEADTADGSAFAVRFDGVDDFVALGALDVDGSGLTLSTWFKADSFPGPSSDPRLVSKALGTSANDHVFMLSTVQVSSVIRLRARVRIGGSTTTLVAGSGDLLVGEWRHAAVTFDGTSLRLYLDAVEVGSTPLSGAVDVAPSIPVAIGNQPFGAGPRSFDGLLDDVRILQRALSAGELLSIVESNQPPVADDDSYTTLEGTALAVDAASGVLGNDDDPESAPLQAILVDDVSSGVLSLNADGSFDFTPNPGFSGEDQFTYRANDGFSDSNLAIVTLAVDAAPVCSGPDGDSDGVPDECDNCSDDINAAQTDGDQDGYGDVCDCDFSESANNACDGPDFANFVSKFGSAVPPANCEYDMVPNGSVGGPDFSRFVTLFGSQPGPACGNPKGTPCTLAGAACPAVDRTPTAADDGYATDEDTTLVVPVATGLLLNDVDINPPDDITALLVSGPTNGTLTAFGADGSFTYVPASDFHGVDGFTYEAVDAGSGTSAQANVTLTVDSINDAPVSGADSFQMQPDTVLVVDAANGVLGNDTDPDLDVLHAILVDDVASGVLDLNPDGSFQYAPVGGFSGQDGFSYRANDSALDSNLALVTISVDTQNDQPHIVTGSIAFDKRVVDGTLGETHAVVAADFTGDGAIDLGATDYIDGMVFWYENDGNGSFTTRVLDADLAGAYPAGVGDVDGDGDFDVLAAGYDADTFAWYESDGSGGFARHDVDTASDGAHSIVSADVDGDGDFDLVTSSQDSNTIAWYENDGANAFSRHVIDGSALGAKRAEVADVDGDGDMDVVTASYDSDEIAWHDNDGSESFTKRVIDASADGAYYVSPTDIDGDGDIDVFAASQNDNTIAWHRNDGASGFSRQNINTGAAGARTVIAADIDGDGSVDAVTATVNDDTIAWYENDGGGGFAGRLVDAGAEGAYGVFTIDVDQDGLLDILSVSRDAAELAIHQQMRAHLAEIDLAGSLVIDSARLRSVDADDGPADLAYTITAAPDFGVLEVGGSAIGFGESFSQADIDAGQLVYTHDGINESEDRFDFSVADGGEDETQPVLGSFSIRIAGLVGPVVVLPLDEGVGTVAGDVSGEGNDGTLVNGAIFEASTGDGSAFAVRFDGVDDFIDLGGVDVNGTGLTLAAQFNADSFPGSSKDPRLISKATGSDEKNHVFMLSTIKVGAVVRLRARVRHAGVTTTLVASSGDLALATWQHAALTYDGTSLRLYLDGVEVGSSMFFGAVDIDPAIPVAVGSQPPGAGTGYFDGLIDDVRILSRAMSAAEVAQIAAGGN